MKHIVRGIFWIKTIPRPDDALERIGARSTLFEKRFEGPLEAMGNVVMIGFMDQELLSGGYVAMERVTGSVEGRIGSFLFQHSSTMTRGVPLQAITVVPDSGTESLRGLAGEMSIDVVDGLHHYNFAYEIIQ